MPTRAAEGVIRFQVEHTTRPLEQRLYGAAAMLAAWREILVRLGLAGRDPPRYEGLGFGNVSARVGPYRGASSGQRRFLVTGTQTGGRARVTLDDCCLVERYDLVRNRVRSVGPVLPSSESLTHGAIYDAVPTARGVLHGHSRELWRHAGALGLAVSAADARSGTREMAREVQRLLRGSTRAAAGIVAMGGHEDGIIAFGRTAPQAGEILVRHLARALALG